MGNKRLDTFCAGASKPLHQRSPAGWLLVGLIVLISVVILALAGIAFFLTEHLTVTSLRQNQTEAIYLAHAGVMRAIYDFRTTAGGNCFTLGEYPITGAAGDDVFILGGKAADFLMANMLPGILSRDTIPGVGKRDQLRAWSVQNILCSSTPPIGLTVQITQMIVSWPNATVPSGQGVIRIELPAGTRVWPLSGTTSSPQASGTPIDIIDTVIPPNTSYTGIIWFSTNNVITDTSDKLPIDVTFQMSDHVVSAPVSSADWSLRIGRYDTQLSNRSGSFTIKSAGEVRRGVFPFSNLWRRIQTEYRLDDSDTTTDPNELGHLRSDPSPTSGRPGYQELSWKTP